MKTWFLLFTIVSATLWIASFILTIYRLIVGMDAIDIIWIGLIAAVCTLAGYHFYKGEVIREAAKSESDD